MIKHIFAATVHAKLDCEKARLEEATIKQQRGTDEGNKGHSEAHLKKLQDTTVIGVREHRNMWRIWSSSRRNPHGQSIKRAQLRKKLQVEGTYVGCARLFRADEA